MKSSAAFNMGAFLLVVISSCAQPLTRPPTPTAAGVLPATPEPAPVAPIPERVPLAASSASVAAVPPITPPGITLQLLKTKDLTRPPEVLFGDAQGRTLYQAGGEAAAGDAAFMPVAAGDGSVPVGDWSLLPRPGGGSYWLYRGILVYTYAKDLEIGDAIGESGGATENTDQGGTKGGWGVLALHPEQSLVRPAGIGVRELADAGGIVLLDADGMTLYAFDGTAALAARDCGGVSECARLWRPLAAPAIAQPLGAFSIVARRDGIVQWTHAGAPLFTYANDLKPTDVNGRGVDTRFRLALVERAFMPADVIVHRSAELGDLLATTGGATLYQHDRVTPFEGHDFRSDRGPPSLGRLLGTASCDARCTQTWLPLAAPAEAVACGDWDVLLRADGTRQWAYKGFALYTYAPDPPGGITGNGIYELATLGDDAGNGAGTTRVPAGSSVAGIGVGAMFWHAVVP